MPTSLSDGSTKPIPLGDILIAQYQNDAALQIAEVYAFRGEVEKAFERLDRAYQQHDPGLVDLKIDPQLKSLRTDPRYTELPKMRLPI